MVALAQQFTEPWTCSRLWLSNPATIPHYQHMTVRPNRAGRRSNALYAAVIGECGVALAADDDLYNGFRKVGSGGVVTGDHPS
jgi:hypothetical protein